MSTQKNEQYHILSPEWLKTNPLPEDGEFENNDGKWLVSSRRGHVTPGWNEYPYRTRRTDLPPEAYITPPTDTTGSGREGETVDALEVEFQQWLEYKTDRGNPDPSPDARMVRRTPIDGLRIAWLDGKKRADAQVEALRRKVAEQERELMDHAEDWAFSGIMPGSKLAGKLAEHDRKRKQEREDSVLLDILEQLATIRWPFGNTAMLAASVEAKEPFTEKPTVRAILRAAIDSAQRQEGM